jgi:hypothetical protein
MVEADPNSPPTGNELKKPTQAPFSSMYMRYLSSSVTNGSSVLMMNRLPSLECRFSGKAAI